MKIIVDKYTYKGFGFDVELQNVEMRFFQDEYHPVIDVVKLSKQVMEELLTSHNDLTGNQINFIRINFQMDKNAFAKLADTTPAIVDQWQAAENNSVKIDPKARDILRAHYVQSMQEAKSHGNAKEKYQGDFFSSKRKLPDSAVIEKAETKKPRGR
jgi:DNA-binding transcriptional regulator YiaG